MRESMNALLVMAMLSWGCASSGGTRTEGTSDPSTAMGSDEDASTKGDDTGQDGQGSTDTPSGDGQGGGSDGATHDDDAGTNTSEADASTAACTGQYTEAQIPSYSGTQPTFTREDLKACQSKCQGMAGSCYSEANCPGIDAWNECAFENVLACVGSQGKSCRAQLETVDCCVHDSGCGDDSKCVQSKCASEIQSFQSCANADKACNDMAPVSCFAPSK